MRRPGLVFALTLLPLFGIACDRNGQPSVTDIQAVEVGLVHWNRDFQMALERARLESKPVLALFQEVPG